MISIMKDIKNDIRMTEKFFKRHLKELSDCIQRFYNKNIPFSIIFQFYDF